jgi:hypothetical protein
VFARHAVLREYAEAAARKLGITGANRHDRVLVGSRPRRRRPATG